MMKKKITIMSALILSSLSFAKTPIGINAKASGDNENEVRLDQLPQTGEGVRIVPLSETYQYKFPQDMQIAFDNEKKLGYVKMASPDAVQLLAMEKNKFLKPEFEKYYNSNETHDIHLKRDLSLIKLAFDFKALSFIPIENTIGFTPAMIYKEGWTAIMQFFTYPKIGTCYYLKSSVSLNRHAIRLAKERISYYINGKPAVGINQGREKDGFAYIINWYDNNYFHTLACAQPHFSKASAQDMIDLAHLIDKE